MGKRLSEEEKAERKRLRDEEKLRVRAEAKRQKIREAEGEIFELPALVLRDGSVRSCTLSEAASSIASYLPALCLDVETTGYPLGHKHYGLRTIQLGGKDAAVVLDAADIEQAEFAGAFLRAAEKLHAHSASADAIPCVVAGLINWDEVWDKMHDSVIYAKLSDPKLSGSDADGLKDLARDILGDRALAPAADKARSKLFQAMGCRTDVTHDTPYELSGWAQVNKNCETMIRYAGSDVLDLGGVLEALPPLPVPDSVLQRERKVQKICAPVAWKGFNLDEDHIKRKIKEAEAAKAEALEAVQILSGGLITNPSSPDVGEKLVTIDPGLAGVLERSEKTGKYSAAKSSLDKVQKFTGLTYALTQAILEYRGQVTKLGLLLRPLEALCDYGDGRMRPTVYTINADTGRMCLPTSHLLLTPSGYKHASALIEGDRTIDADGNWVSVLAVHQYRAAPLVSINSRGLKLSATAEHRWVTTLEHRPKAERELRTMDARPRLRLHLAPVGGFAFSYGAVQADTEDERFAALVGMLVTDGRCVETEEGLRAYVYQTERKYLKAFLRVIPDNAIMYDRITDGKDHHEIRINARWLRPRLEAAGLSLPTEGLRLKDVHALHGWLSGLSIVEVRAFFSACWLSDGVQAKKGRTRMLSCGSDNLRKVLTLAAYRLGYVTTEHEAQPSEWSNGTRTYLSFREPIVSTHRNVPFEDGVSDVWCVTTETGTFTAVNEEGTVYLTGNSCVRPNGQQFSRRGGIRACVTAD